MTIETRRLPGRCLMDTGVICRALGDRPDEPVSKVCVDLLAAIIGSGKTVLVAAPSIVEMIDVPDPTPLPAVANIEPVAFDYGAAEVLAQRLPRSILEEIKQETGLSRAYVKYDAQIVACAIRHRAEVVIALDGDVHRFCAAAGIPCHRPEHYLDPQLSLEDIRIPAPPGSPSTVDVKDETD